MKRFLLFIIMSLSISACGFAQTIIDGQDISTFRNSNSVVFIRYTYDGAGNIIRKNWMYGTLQNLMSENEHDEPSSLVNQARVRITGNGTWESVRVSIAGENVESGILLVYSISGALMGSYPFSGNEFTIDLSFLERSLYVFRIETETFNTDYKITKRK